MHVYKNKRHRYVQKIIKGRTDCCLSCNTHFKTGKIKIIWKDVVECGKCGSIWILFDQKKYLFWKNKEAKSEFSIDKESIDQSFKSLGVRIMIGLFMKIVSQKSFNKNALPLSRKGTNLTCSLTGEQTFNTIPKIKPKKQMIVH